MQQASKECAIVLTTHHLEEGGGARAACDDHGCGCTALHRDAAASEGEVRARVRGAGECVREAGYLEEAETGLPELLPGSTVTEVHSLRITRVEVVTDLPDPPYTSTQSALVHLLCVTCLT